MQFQLNIAARRRIWRTLALTFSASTLTLALCVRPAKVQGLTAHDAAPEASPAARVVPELAALAPSHPLRDSGDRAALESLMASAERGEPKLVRSALAEIARIGGDRAREFLARRFHGAADGALPDIATALATLGDAQARAILLASARSSRPATRAAAFDALSTLDTEDVRDFMLQALTFLEPTPAASYFSNCREPRALPALERLARSGAPEQRRVAIDSLFAQGTSADDAIFRLLREDDELCDALLEGQPTTLAARRALRRVSIARLRAGALTTGLVFEFLQRDSSNEARLALLQAARDPASRDSAISALSVRGDRASLQALSTLANDAEPALAERASCALLSQPDSRSAPFILRLHRAPLQ